ncbi:prolyl oligopeptidase family serine peptidase [Fulvivirgaceae bacterium PWU4]|uniref:Prolyl oligopeptidase family serine peptidase n=1 Tax=Chryseosolibacter histidini TaxID=2782349 RepID=A0AAP2GIA5_9BACT|nr:PHB depolymerase family esterase [Chryseosolibacter histidini]MBT1696966.1 prolyl oligopeptidase family serine peptidase [Chryseosolibacter histidini]
MTNPIVNLFAFLSLLLFVHCDGSDPAIPEDHRFYETMMVDGRARTYLLNLPPDYYKTNEDLPLVIGLHGTGGNAGQFERDYGLTEKANSAGFIVVYPEGIRSNGVLGVRTWNAGRCCDFAMKNNIDDVLFIRTLIDKLVSTFRVDAKRVYVTGMSNGGMMAYRLACEMPEKIAAIAAVSSTMVVASPCHPSRPVPVLHMHSVLDAKVPYNGGKGIGGYYFPPVDSVLGAWSAANGCAVRDEIRNDDDRFKLTEWLNCTDDVMIQYYLTRDGGHAWPGGQRSGNWGDTPSTVINATDLLWEFFKQFEAQ